MEPNAVQLAGGDQSSTPSAQEEYARRIISDQQRGQHIMVGYVKKKPTSGGGGFFGDGWKLRYLLLQSKTGTLSYFKNKAESSWSAPQGTIQLNDQMKVNLTATDHVVVTDNAGKEVLHMHPCTESGQTFTPAEKQAAECSKWFTALESAMNHLNYSSWEKNALIS